MLQVRIKMKVHWWNAGCQVFRYTFSPKKPE